MPHYAVGHSRFCGASSTTQHKMTAWRNNDSENRKFSFKQCLDLRHCCSSSIFIRLQPVSRISTIGHARVDISNEVFLSTRTMAEDGQQEEELLYEEEAQEEETNTTSAPVAAKKEKGDYASVHSSTFKDFLLKDELLKAITDCGFEHPSEGKFSSTENSHIVF